MGILNPYSKWFYAVLVCAFQKTEMKIFAKMFCLKSKKSCFLLKIQKTLYFWATTDS